VRHIIQAPALFPLDNPAIVSVPLGFIAAIIAALMTRDPEAESSYPELAVRANTGLQAEV
jgi:cation/acetate symporter